MTTQMATLYREYVVFFDGELHYAESADEDPGFFLQMRLCSQTKLNRAIDELHACGNTDPPWLQWGPGPETYIDLDARRAGGGGLRLSMLPASLSP